MLSSRSSQPNNTNSKRQPCISGWSAVRRKNQKNTCTLNRIKGMAHHARAQTSTSRNVHSDVHTHAYIQNGRLAVYEHVPMASNAAAGINPSLRAAVRARMMCICVVDESSHPIIDSRVCVCKLNFRYLVPHKSPVKDANVRRPC